MALTYDELQWCVQAAVPKFAQNWLNPQQNDAVSAPPEPPVFIVAGPGTGKTTVLALRVLRHIFVDEFPPNSIMATTFTRKAASELRSRILSWGVVTQQQAQTQAEANADEETVQWLENLNTWQSGQSESLPTFTPDFLLQRAVRIVPVDTAAIDQAVTEIDNVISQIEGCALHENARGNIPNNWGADGGAGDCDACDFRRFCPSPAQYRSSGQTPPPPQAPG